MWAKGRGRSGLRIRGERGHPVVRRCLIRYGVWLRANYEFPVLVAVYLHPGPTFIASNGEVVVSSFFGPDDAREEPFIRISTGDYPDLQRERGRDNALASYVIELSRQLVCYRHWLATGDISPSNLHKRSLAMLRRYNQDVAHP